MSPKRIARALAGFGTVALVLLFAATVWVVRHHGSAQALEKAAGFVPGALLHAHNFHWTQMKAGERQWVMTAADASYSGDRTALTLIEADLSMISEDGKAVRVTAPHALLFLKGNHVTRADLSGGTVIRYGDFKMSTDSASFMPDDNRVEAPGLVTVEGEGMKVTGLGLTGNSRTRQFDLHGQVQTEISPKQGSEKPKQS
ncbi:MAG TPA: LPS export ABC transporter periplasmic protein LptC [Candidatus Binataceae bacterium]|nr:LPS export ABC transporter periplasmic protein LptC [Candidatus Binataceae bacterium]